ncbi:peptidase S9 prolyl oligopeptidase active sitedomain-containing protein [Treponema pedis str. T A4]|uniref:Peptidase S9 prolyl oligopeptidase active sitedomain-containing protein n=2 Tax=Treponema pedis TaxID=409322 RepID=S6A4T1_9SPIR|nr:peptidase S9 prolyl oligopeptidase active sitedomain-containing protein [Treponema pedis str. T A4]
MEVLMKKLLLFLCTAVLLSACTANNSVKPSAQPIPLEDFFRNPEKTGYSVSPDGTHIAFLQPWKNRLNIFVQKLGDDNAVKITSAEERDISSYFWKSDNVIAFLQDSGGDENYKLFVVNKDGTNEKALTPFDNVTVEIVDDLEDRENEMLIAMNKRNPQIFDVYRIDIATGDLTMIAENPGNISGWMTDHEGKLRVATTTDGVNTGLLYRKTEAEQFVKIMETGFKDNFNPLLMTFDNKELYVASNIDRDKAALYTFNPETKKLGEMIFESDEADVNRILYSKKRKTITGVSYYTDKRHVHFFDEERQAMQEDLEKQLPDIEINVVSSDKNETTFIIRTFSDKTSGSFYIYNKETKKLTLLTDVAPWIKPENMASMKPVQYKSSDGLTIHGYLTLPVGKENEKNLPVVINPHGGPWARDYWGFSPETQFLANRGYAVLQMNFRGSIGYGKEFWIKGFKQWGKKMQDDITDGVNWLIAEGIADPKRIAIYGASYGGYAVLAGVTFTPDLYACAIDYVGVSNIFTLFETLPPYWEQGRKMMYEMIGNPETEKDMLTEVSPIFHIDNIKVPLFVAQGANDPRVKKEHSDQIVEALKKKNIDVEYMVKDNEGHGFSNEENRFDFYRAMEKFLQKHIGK